jgi:hypothetical protein
MRHTEGQFERLRAIGVLAKEKAEIASRLATIRDSKKHFEPSSYRFGYSQTLLRQPRQRQSLRSAINP